MLIVGCIVWKFKSESHLQLAKFLAIILKEGFSFLSYPVWQCFPECGMPTTSGMRKDFKGYAAKRND
jgi:hypothetical protein